MMIGKRRTRPRFAGSWEARPSPIGPCVAEPAEWRHSDPHVPCPVPVDDLSIGTPPTLLPYTARIKDGPDH